MNHSGACAASAVDRILAKGFSPCLATASSEANTTALAPSSNVDALAAVTVPSRSKAGQKRVLSIFVAVFLITIHNQVVSTTRGTETAPPLP